MSPMSEQPVTLAVLTKALAGFHRDVVLPDLERVVAESERRLRNEMHTLHDFVLDKLGTLEAEYAAIRMALARVEERLDRVEERLDRVEQRLDGLDARLGTLEQHHADLVASLHRLEERLSRIEARLDALSSEGERATMKAEVERLRVRVGALHDEIRRLDARIRRSAGE